MQNFRFSAVLDGGRASHQPDDPQLISYGSCGRSAAVRGISSVLQYRGIVKDAQKIGNELADLYREILAK